MSEDMSDLIGDEPEPTAAAAPSREIVPRKKFKHSQERMLTLLIAMRAMPVEGDACLLAGISRSCLVYWLKRSSEGGPGDGYDVPERWWTDSPDYDEPVRFHTAWDDAKTFGVDSIEKAAINKALGQLEPQVFQGRVIYQLDPDLVDLGATGAAAYLRDENGKPIPETVMKQDSDLMQFILKARKPEVYGNKQSIDITHQGGVLVVGVQAKSAEEVTQLENDYRQKGVPPIIFDEGSFNDVA
jgi:hypothetical protein